MPLSNEDFQALKNRISTCIKAAHANDIIQFFADFDLLHTEAPAAALTLWQTKPSNILKLGLCSLRTRAAYLQLLGKLVVTSHVPYAVVFWNNLPHHLEQLALQAVFSSENTEVIAYMQFLDQHLNNIKPLKAFDILCYSQQRVGSALFIPGLSDPISIPNRVKNSSNTEVILVCFNLLKRLNDHTS